MKIIGINASPRKKANTQTLVEAVLEGAAEKGAETRMVNLREMNINGCLGCEGCKKHLGKCVQKDDFHNISFCVKYNVLLPMNISVMLSSDNISYTKQQIRFGF